MGWARGWQPAPLRGHSRLGITVLSACLQTSLPQSPPIKSQSQAKSPRHLLSPATYSSLPAPFTPTPMQGAPPSPHC